MAFNQLKRIIWGAAVLIGLSSCTKYNYIDTGLANGVHDCTMWEYFHTNSYDWDSTILMIEHAGLKSLFDGTDYKQITFFGVTNLSIETFMLEHNDLYLETDPEYWRRVTDIPAADCKQLLERLVVPNQRIMLNDVPRGTRVQEENEAGVSEYRENEGKVYPTIGEELFVWTTRGIWHEVDEAGAIQLWIARRNNQSDNFQVGSSNIQTTNGVVNALNYSFDLRKFLNMQ